MKCQKCLKVVSKINKTRHIWTKEEKEYLGEITSGKHRKEILDLMNKKFEYNFNLAQIENAIKRFGYNTGFNGQFKKGHKTWNKGTKGLTGINKTSFKKGHKPWNKKEVGSERTDVEGYILIKVKEPNVWKLKHRILYEKYHNVKLTSDDMIIFADQNKLNFEKDNLILISKRKSLTMVTNKLFFKDKELTKTGVNIAELIIKINEKRK